MAATTRPSTLPGFDSLGSNISLYKASRRHDEDTPNDPALVILCTWMGASQKHISKYTSGYQALFPSSDILLIQAEISDFILGTFWGQRRRLRTATGIVRAALKTSDWEGEGSTSPPPILLCAMSDGGLNSATHLAHALIYSCHYAAMPARAIILDSCPSLPRLRKGIQAFTMTLPKTLLPRVLGTVVIYLYLIVWWLLKAFGDFSPLGINARHLNAGRTTNKTCPRLYIFSKGDQLTNWEDVTRHADEATALGYPTRRLIFSGSPHCGHILEDSTKYWAAVKHTWRRA